SRSGNCRACRVVSAPWRADQPCYAASTEIQQTKRQGPKRMTVRVTLAADDVLEITLAAPEHANALDAAMADIMLKAVRELPETAKAIALTAEGADFCAGRRGGMPPRDGKHTALGN